MFNIKETASVLGISEITVRRHIYNGHIHAVKIGRGYKISRQEIERIKREGFDERLR